MRFTETVSSAGLATLESASAAKVIRLGPAHSLAHLGLRCGRVTECCAKLGSHQPETCVHCGFRARCAWLAARNLHPEGVRQAWRPNSLSDSSKIYALIGSRGPTAVLAARITQSIR